MASRFWVGGGSANTWAATANTNWATTSGGSNNASVPGSSDVAIFDSNSGSSNSVIGANITVTGLECDGNALGTGTYAGTITHNTAVTLTINTGAASSLRFTAGMTYTPASTSALVTFTNTTGTASLKSAGKSFFAITQNGAGGTVQQVDDLLVNAGQNAVLTITTGIWDCNSHALTANILTNNSGSTRSLLLGTGLSVGGNVTSGTTILTHSNTTGLTFTKNSANITVLTPSGTTIGWTFAGGGLTYNGITINQSNTGSILSFTGANTFSSFSSSPGWTHQFPNGSTTTISSAFTLTGTQARPIVLQTSSGSNTTTLSVASGTCTLAWGALGALVGSGGATFTATNVFDLGSNTGWSITPPMDVAGVNVAQIAGSATAATNLGQTTQAIARCTAASSATTTSVPTSACSPSGASANQFSGRTMLFDAGTATTTLRGVAAAITGSTNAATPTFTVSTLPAAPASGDTFSIV